MQSDKKVNILSSLGIQPPEAYNDEGKLIAAVQLGRLGGSKKSRKKAEAVRQNGFAPCRPGKKRGRPFGTKKKK